MQDNSNNETFDRAQAFLLYTTFTADVERTAHALGVSPVSILRVADAEGWNAKLQNIIALSKSQRPGDFERAVNRALNFTQCHRTRLFLERVLTKLTGFTDEELTHYIFSAHADKTGEKYSKLTTRAVADLTSALEKCHAMSYLALGDTAQDRNRRQEQTDDGASVGVLHIQIAKAMSEAGASTTPRGLLLDAQLEQAASAKARAERQPEGNPNDNDDH